MEKEMDTFCPAGPHEWRAWLEQHHRSRRSVWLVQYRKHTGEPTLTWSEAVDEALCFGWIDSTRRTLDADRYVQLFTPRKPGSAWSKVNKDKVEQLIAAGRMTAAGHESIAVAKANGNWSLMDEVEALIVPPDLEAALAKYPAAAAFFDGLSKSAKKMQLQRIVAAKRPETRARRIAEIAEAASRGKVPG